MVDQPQIPVGCQIIPLYRNISGDNFHPIYKIVGYTIVDDVDFQWLNQYRWFMTEDIRSGDHYAARYEHQNGKIVNILMAREILGLPHGVGRGGFKADHADHNTLSNRRMNLRVATNSQSTANQRKRSSKLLPKGVVKHRNKYRAHIKIDGLHVCFTVIPVKTEAAWMRRYAEIIVQDRFACFEELPEEEKPLRERRWELFGLVVDKLSQEGVLFF